jgi:glycosyltransferase involved in cell wall biosynthesis
MRILILTDAWYPQVNGVVRTLDSVATELRAMGDEVRFVTPDLFANLPCPTYPEIRLALVTPRRIAAIVDEFRPDAIHIATEGPIGLAGRHACLARGLVFTTSFHTRFPEYVHARCRLPVSAGYRMVRWFHGAAHSTMVATETLRRELASRGFGRLALWTQGVDAALFHPGAKDLVAGPRPVWLYVGRVAVEKNIEAFLALDIGGTKVVVGDGPLIDRLRRRYRAVQFAGTQSGAALAAYYATADVFVFPSRTDTFGNVLLEALACGVPVAAYPVPGPRDVINGCPVGVLDEDLAGAARRALAISPDACRAFALRRTWRDSALQFRGNLVPTNAAAQWRPEPAASESSLGAGASSSAASSSSSSSTTGTA